MPLTRQHVGLVFVYFGYPMLVAQAAGGTPRGASTMVSFTLAAMAAGTVLQVTRFGWIGAAILCQPTPSVV